MSIQAVAWVLDNSRESYGNRLVLISLANHADAEGGNAWPSVETLGRESMLTARQARRCLRLLEESGAIRQTGISESGTRIYAVNLRVENSGGKGEDKMSPPGHLRPEGRTSASFEVSQMSAEPSLEQPSIEHPSVKLEPRAEKAVDKRLWKVDRVAVTEIETALAGQVLAEWNQQAGQALRSKDWLAKIVMRIREHPELGIEEHSHVIYAALADPWWKGAASPSVVYGSGAQFERSIVAAANGQGESKVERVLRVARETMEGRR